MIRVVPAHRDLVRAARTGSSAATSHPPTPPQTDSPCAPPLQIGSPAPPHLPQWLRIRHHCDHCAMYANLPGHDPAGRDSPPPPVPPPSSGAGCGARRLGPGRPAGRAERAGRIFCPAAPAWPNGTRCAEDCCAVAGAEVVSVLGAAATAATARAYGVRRRQWRSGMMTRTVAGAGQWGRTDSETRNRRHAATHGARTPAQPAFNRQQPRSRCAGLP